MCVCVIKYLPNALQHKSFVTYMGNPKVVYGIPDCPLWHNQPWKCSSAQSAEQFVLQQTRNIKAMTVITKKKVKQIDKLISETNNLVADGLLRL
jgi:hypothetical protein